MKLDGVGTIHNTPSTDWLPHFVKKKKKKKIIKKNWHVLCRTWQVTCDKWHMTCFQNFSSLALMVWKSQCFEDWEEKTDRLIWFFFIYLFIERGQTDCIATTWPNQPSGPTCIFFTVAKTPKKCSVFKNIFLENGPTWGFSNSKTSVRLESQCLPYTGFFFNSKGGWGLHCQD